jgi:hypothetical protein
MKEPFKVAIGRGRNIIELINRLNSGLEFESWTFFRISVPISCHDRCSRTVNRSSSIRFAEAVITAIISAYRQAANARVSLDSRWVRIGSHYYGHIYSLEIHIELIYSLCATHGELQEENYCPPTQYLAAIEEKAGSGRR